MLSFSIDDAQAGTICAALLRDLPEWFGIPEANDHYAAMATEHPTVIARLAKKPVGICTIWRHHPMSAEVYLMAVLRAYHRQGIGRLLLAEVERQLASDGVRFLQVKTLAERHPDPGYAHTRAFYLAQGFVHLETFDELWGEHNPALQLIKQLDPADCGSH